MKRLERLAAALTPKRWPVRWRLAAVSAALTFLILVMFALVVGRLTENRMEANFNDELQDAATQAVRELQFTGASDPAQTLAGADAARVIDRAGQPFPFPDPKSPTPNLGPPPADIPGFTNVRPQHGQSRRDDRAPVALPRSRGAGRHGLGCTGRIDGRRAGDAPDRDADRHGPDDRQHAGSLAADPRPRARRRGGRAGAHPRPDAPRAGCGALGDRAADAPAARVRRRRVSRAAHSADQHPGQSGAAPGPPGPRLRQRRRAGDGRLGSALVAANEPPRLRPAAAGARGRGPNGRA